MDSVPIIIGILAINVAVFLGGCVLALYRTWHEWRRTRRRPNVALRRPSHQSPR
jgi:hypothetical protein